MNTIHCHGDHIMFHILKDYPVQVFNWHAWESLPALDEAYALTGKCLMGGLSRTDITQQNRGAIQNQIFQCFKLLGGRHQILTPGCVIRYPLDDDMLSFIGTTRNEIEAVLTSADAAVISRARLMNSGPPGEQLALQAAD